MKLSECVLLLAEERCKHIDLTTPCEYDHKRGPRRKGQCHFLGLEDDLGHLRKSNVASAASVKILKRGRGLVRTLDTPGSLSATNHERLLRGPGSHCLTALWLLRVQSSLTTDIWVSPTTPEFVSRLKNTPNSTPSTRALGSRLKTDAHAAV